MNTDMKFDVCDICGSEMNKILLSGNFSNQEYKIVKCLRCGLIFLTPRRNQRTFDSQYSKEYFTESFLKKKQKRKIYFEKMLKEIMEIKSGRKILDVGCGVGLFLNIAREKGWECYGVEPSIWAASYCQNKENLNVRNGRLEEIKYPDNFFDLITFWDVLEHVKRPSMTLKEAKRIIKNNGLIVSKFPNIDSYIYKLRIIITKLKGGTGRLHIPNHFYHFSPKTAKNLFRISGFNPLKTVTISEVEFEEFSKRGTIHNLIWEIAKTMGKFTNKSECIIVYATPRIND